MNRDRTIDSDAESYYGFASEGVPGLRSRRDEYDPDVDDKEVEQAQGELTASGVAGDGAM